MRILVASEPGSAGVKRHIIDYLSRIDLQDFDLLFAYSLVRSDARYPEELRQLAARGIQLHEMRMSGGVAPWMDTLALFEAIRLIRQWKPDVVHVHSSKAAFIFRLAAQLGNPRPRTMYTPNALACYFSRFFHQLELLASKWTDLFVAVSPSERDDFIRWKIADESRIVTLNTGVGQDLVPGTAAHPKIIAACGRICYQKNSLLFFQAMELVAQKDPDVRFRWIGSHSNDQESRAVQDLLSRSPYRDRFEITGWVDKVEAHLAEATLFCSLSRYDAFPYVVTDAMQLKLPVIGLNVTGTRDLVRDQVTGIIVEPQPEAVADAAVTLLQKEDLCRQWGEAGRRFIVENCSADRMTSEIESIYKKLASPEPVCL
jgi:glycosyltransferase involved in cell wall biosynthesis